MPNDTTGGNGHKLKQKRFYLNIRKYITARVTELWHRLSNEVMKPLLGDLQKAIWTWSWAHITYILPEQEILQGFKVLHAIFIYVYEIPLYLQIWEPKLK